MGPTPGSHASHWPAHCVCHTVPLACLSPCPTRLCATKSHCAMRLAPTSHRRFTPTAQPQWRVEQVPLRRATRADATQPCPSHCLATTRPFCASHSRRGLLSLSHPLGYLARHTALQPGPLVRHTVLPPGPIGGEHRQRPIAQARRPLPPPKRRRPAACPLVPKAPSAPPRRRRQPLSR